MTALLCAFLGLVALSPALAWLRVARDLRALEEREELRRFAADNPYLVQSLNATMNLMARSGITVDREALERLKEEAAGSGLPL